MRIPARISSAYATGLVWANCDGATNPIRNAATDEMPPSDAQQSERGGAVAARVIRLRSP